ncbi:hypothetical protein Tco_0911689 [Tanacetum coccineum]|uniref:Uncharacterized protein n=1 Tax=Tanacetum coccineum TaxID=301880 RepID=A0ABQ5CXC4_9ASTR
MPEDNTDQDLGTTSTSMDNMDVSVVCTPLGGRTPCVGTIGLFGFTFAMIYYAISLDDMSTISSAGVSGIGNNPTFDVVDTSQPVCSVCKLSISGCFPKSHASVTSLPNVGITMFVLWICPWGAHSMATPIGSYQFSLKNNIPDLVGLFISGDHPRNTVHCEACNETCQHYARSSPPKFHRCCNWGRVVLRTYKVYPGHDSLGRILDDVIWVHVGLLDQIGLPLPGSLRRNTILKSEHYRNITSSAMAQQVMIVPQWLRLIPLNGPKQERTRNRFPLSVLLKGPYEVILEMMGFMYTPFRSRVNGNEFRAAFWSFSPEGVERFQVVGVGVPVATLTFNLHLKGFPAQSVGSSNTDVLDSPCLLVLITGTSQSRQHVITSLIHIESCKSPTAELFEVDSGRISIRHCEY